MNLIALPVIIPVLAAALCLAGWQSRAVQRAVSVVAGIAQIFSAVFILMRTSTGEILTLEVGGWPAPFGIVFVADVFSAIMVLVAAVVVLLVNIYSMEFIENEREQLGYYCLIQVLLLGVTGSFLTGDIFNLYVWFEVMLISSFVLMCLGCERDQMEGAIKYVVINLVASAVFLAATGVLYGMMGTLNFAHLAMLVEEYPSRGMILSVGMLFFIAFGIKAAVFPLFFWLPASYHTPPIAVSAVLAGLLTKVGVYAMIRVFTLVIVDTSGYIQELLLIVAGLTMIIGVLGAIAQNDMRRILSFHIISQIGYMIMGLGIFTKAAIAGAVFYIAHHIIVKTNLFLISGAVYKMKGTYKLKELGGIYKNSLFWSFLFLIPALSLAGIPPLSGFFSKFLVIRSGLEASQQMIVWVALACGILTMFSMTKIWNEVFWKESPEAQINRSAVGLRMMLPIVSMALMTVCIGIFAGPISDLADTASSQLLDTEAYIEAVLGERAGLQ